MPHYNLKVATGADKETLVSLFSLFKDESPYRDFEINREHVGALVENILNSEGDSAMAILAIDQDTGDAVGMIVGHYSVFPVTGQKIAAEMAFWVHKDFRKSRLARDLLDAFLFWSEHICKASLISLASLENGHQDSLDVLYRRLGFKKSETAYLKRL